MQGNLHELLKINTFSVQLTMLLERVSKLFAHMLQIQQQNKKSNKQSIPLSTIKQLEHHLISLTCQNKNLLHYKYLENKLNNEHCIAYIVEILTCTSKIYPGSSQHISSSFISHVLSHMSCYICFYTFLMVIENCQQILNEIPYSKLLDINLKIQKQENIFDDIKMLHSIQLSNHEIFARDHLQICEKNLNHYLQQREKPKQFRNTQTVPQKQDKSIQIKIPPLILPTSKSINSERFSAISKEENPKGIQDLLKLATGLGENFVTVELGCLLANKRTRQVQQYSQNQSFRQKCIEKIEKIHTERMNSSRMNIEQLQGPANDTYPLKDKPNGQENTRKYYSKVFAVNLNIFLKKIKLEKQTHTFLDFISEFVRKTIYQKKHNDEPIKERFFVSVIEMLKQVIDMTVVGGLMLNEQELEDQNARVLKSEYQMHNISVFTLLLKNMKPTREIAKQLANIVSLESEKLHKYLLINQNKRNKAFHYDYEAVKYPLNQHYPGLDQKIETGSHHDQLLSDIMINVNEPIRKKGPFKLYCDKKQRQSEFLMHIKRNSDPILLYISNFLQSLQQSADMNHPLFYNYQTNTLRVLNFYLKATLENNKVSIFYVTEFLTPLLIMLKRQLLELSHPYFEREQADYNLNSSNTISSASHMGKKKAKGFFKQKQVNSQRYSKPLIFSNPELMGEYMKLLTNLLETGLSSQDHSTYSKRNKYIEKLVANLYIKNIYFMELLENFTEYIFANKRDHEIAIILNFYRRALEVYSSHSPGKSKHGSQEHRHLRYLYQHLASYLEPKTGCIAIILNNYEKFISPQTLEEAEAEEINFPETPHQKTSSGIQYMLHQIFKFIASIYYISSPDNNQALIVLEEQISSFYIKYSIMGFIKLYSLLTVTQLVNINTGSGMKRQIQFILSTKESPHSSSQANVKQIFMIDFLKILTNMSINRTPEIAKKFREYRVLEFFVREIQLEFSVSENIEKYIRKGKEVQHLDSFKQQMMPFQTEIDHRQDSSSEDYMQEPFRPKCPPLQLDMKPSRNEKEKKISVPGLNLTGKLFQKSSAEDSYESQSIQESLNKNSQPSGHKVKPLVQKLPLKTEENSHYSSKNTYKQEAGHRKKGLLDDTIEEIVRHKRRGDKSHEKGHKKSGKDRKKSAKTKAIKTESNPNSNLNLGLNLNFDNLKLKSKDNEHFGDHGKSTTKNSDTQLIYQTERKIRKIYSNKLLHSESILLILSLILYRGQLDPLYCDQMPIIHGKLNVLYLLHYHLNHESNKSILPILAENVKKIKPYLCGQRIFKLLSNAYTDLSQYHSWTKLNAGAFGVVMRANTYLDNPQQVAVKQMNFPKSIYQRCVLHDIFTEITCLELFRLEERVTKMYNYGVIDNTYVIIMKKYACSVRDWRLCNVQNSIINNFAPTLPNILALFYEILKGLKFLHDHNVTHYDIKGDNILLDFGETVSSRQCPLPKAVFADFGVCKSYEDQRDQLDLKSRGTECIKSPEMLTLTLKNKKEADNYDRRKKIGTTKASDIWSLGCLLYQLVTGDYLFNSNDWVHFFMQVTSPTEQILNQQQCQKLNNNVYLIDFLKYILIRDPQHRPSIHNIISRFQNLYALLVSNPERFASNELRKCSKKNLNDSVLKYIEMITAEQNYLSVEYHEAQKAKKKQKNPVALHRKYPQAQLAKTEKVITKPYGRMMKIMEDIYICDSQKYLAEHQAHIRNQGVTHIILMKGASLHTNAFKVFEIDLKDHQFLGTLMYRLCPRISDCLREVLLLKGKLLFVNNQTNYAANLLIFMLSYWFKCSVYETWCLINTQILSFPMLASNQNLGTMSKMLSHLNQIQTEAQSFPKLQCICGSVTIILKKKFQEKKGELRPCRCNKKSMDKAQCLSRNCPEYLEFIKKRYNIIWDNLTWAFINPSDLLTSLSRDDENSLDSIRSNIILNSAHPLDNMFYEENQSGGYRVASCRVCEMWMMSFKQNETWVILNNLIKSYRQGIMIPNAQQEFKMRTPALNYFTLSKLHMTQ